MVDMKKYEEFVKFLENIDSAYTYYRVKIESEFSDVKNISDREKKKIISETNTAWDKIRNNLNEMSFDILNLENI